jgi:hypothetical protein
MGDERQRLMSGADVDVMLSHIAKIILAELALSVFT